MRRVHVLLNYVFSVAQQGSLAHTPEKKGGVIVWHEAVRSGPSHPEALEKFLGYFASSRDQRLRGTETSTASKSGKGRVVKTKRKSSGKGSSTSSASSSSSSSSPARLAQAAVVEPPHDSAADGVAADEEDHSDEIDLC
jgi:hypothetical protein